MATAEYTDLSKELGDKIVGLTLKQAKELSDYLENVHGIKAAAGGGVMMAAPASTGPAPVVEAKTEFDVILEGLEDATKKIGVLKVVRTATGLGLAEAKALVEGAPKPVKVGVSKEDADKLAKELKEAGAKITIK